MNKGQILFQKALYQLDRANVIDAELNLRKAIDISKKENEEITLYSAMTCLGKLLFEMQKSEEAIVYLLPVSKLKRDDDLLNYEILTAKKIVDMLQK
jgi:hypothetical protein